jgi:hypothetical protein
MKVQNFITIAMLSIFVQILHGQSTSCEMPNAIFQSGANFGDSFLTSSPSYSFWFSSIIKKTDQDYFYLNSNIVQSPLTGSTFTQRNLKMLHFDKNAMTYLDQKIKFENNNTRILTMIPINNQEYYLSGTTDLGLKSKGLIKKYNASSPTDSSYKLTENFWIPIPNIINMGDVIIKTIVHQNKIYSIGYTMFADSSNTSISFSRRPIIYVNDGNNDYFYNFDHRGAVIDIISNQQDVYIITIEDAAMNEPNPAYIYKLNEQNNQIELEGQKYITDLIAGPPSSNPPVFFTKMNFNNAGDKIYVLFRYGSHNLTQTKGYGGFVEFDLNLKELNAYHFDFPRLPLTVDYINNGPPTPIPDIFLSCMQFDQNDNILIGGLYKNFSHPFPDSLNSPANLLGTITLLFDRQNPGTFFGYEEGITTQTKEASPYFKTGSAVNSNSLDNKLPEFIALTTDKSRLHIVGTNDEIYWDGIAPNRYPMFTKSILKHKSRPVQDYYDQSISESCDTCIYSTFLGTTRYPRFVSGAHRRLIKSNQHGFLIREGKFMETKSSEDYLTTCMDTIKDTVTGCHYPIKIARSTDTLCKNGKIRLHAITSTPYWNQSLLWSNGSTDTFIEVTKEGNYSIIWTRYLTDGAVCEMYDTIKIHKPIDAKIETIFDIDEICQGEKIEIKSTPLLQKSYLWYSNNIVLSNTKGINVLIPGTYTVQVTMQNGCVDTVSKRIYQKGLTLKQTASNTNPTLHDTIILTATVCNNESTVAVNTPFEAILPEGFVYIGSNIAGVVYDSVSRKVSYKIPTIAARIGDNVSCVAISYQVKAINLCKVSHRMQIANIACLPPILVDSLQFNTQSSHQVSITAPKTKGCQKESILLSANILPNTGTISYQWKLNDTVIPNATSNNYFTNKTGSYTVEAIRNGCLLESNKIILSISDTLKTNDSFNDNFCVGKNNGMIIINPSGGFAPYKYKWSKNSNTYTIKTLEDSSKLRNLTEDTFHVMITDFNNCKVSKTFIIKTQKSISFDLIDTVDSDCNKNNGSVFISNINAYDTSIIRFYNVTNSFDILDKKISNLAPGNYLIRMTDSNKCINEKSVIIKRINIPFDIEINKQNKCNNFVGGTYLGSIFLTPKGKSPFTYKWNDGDTKSYKEDLNEGTYIVTVTDSNLCEQRDTINVIASPKMDSIKISATLINCTPYNEKYQYTVNHIGGTPPFTYVWSPTPISSINNSAIITGKPDRIYLTITDALGCEKNTLTYSSGINFDFFHQLGEGSSKPTKSSASSIFSNNILDNSKVIIKGNFTIDQATTIQNSEIILSNYFDNVSFTYKLGKITSAVPNNMGDFKLINCTIRTCDDGLAHGIEVDNSNIYMQGNKIYDMITGLTIKNNVKLFLHNNLFENNRIGIEYVTTNGILSTFNSPSFPNIDYHFTGNSFIGGPLKTNFSPLMSNNYPNTIGSNLNYSYIGIASKNNIGFDIGKSSGFFPSGNVYSQNKFYKMNNGIVLTQGNYTIKNFKIYDYNDEVVPAITPTKKGIIAINSANIEPTSSIGAKLVVNGDNDSTNFFSLTHAIEANGYELEVLKTKMHFIEQAAITYNASNNRLLNKFNIQHNQLISTKQFTFNYIDNTSRPTQGNFSNNQVESGNFINSNPLINFNKSILSSLSNESLTINNNRISNQRNIISLNINRFRNINFSNNQFITGGSNVNIDAKITNCIDLLETNNKYYTTYSGNGKNETSINNSFSVNNIYPLNALYDSVSNASISCNHYVGYSNILFMNNLSGLNLTNNNFVGRNHRILIDQNCIFPKQVLKGNRFYFATRASGAKDIFSKVATTFPVLFETKSLPSSLLNIPIGSAPIINSDGCPTDFYWYPNAIYLSPTNVIQTISSSIKEPFECCLGRRVTQPQARPMEQPIQDIEIAYTYPNPSNGEINIEFFNSIDGVLSVEIYDLNSNCVLKINKEAINNHLNIEANHLLSGIYLVNVMKNNETLYQTKVEIKKSMAK